MSVVKIPDPPKVVAQRPAPRVEAEAAAPTSRVAPARQAAADDAAHVRELAAEERARIAERLQEMARASGRELEFRIDEASDRMVIVVRDQSTGELIRQIPDATALRISQRLESQVEAMRSVLFEGRV
jgi:flagellar protein FlaG